MTVKTKAYHQANRRRWNAAAQNWADCADSRGIWRRCHQEPKLVFGEALMRYFKHIAGKSVAVLGSGDNQAVFALAGLGAKVTSVDISREQLKFAKQRSRELGLAIDFVEADVVDLQMFRDDEFDVVFTGGHVAVWVADLRSYYREAVRVLKSGGRFIVEEYHPFRRIWKESEDELVVGFSYFDSGPYRYLVNDNVLYEQQGDLESYEFHWTVSDMLSAVIKAGAQIEEVVEYGDAYADWESAPVGGLPEHLLIVAKKSVV